MEGRRQFSMDGTPVRITSVKKKPSCLKRFSNSIIWALESAFCRLGLFVGANPIIVIVFSLTTCGLCGIGFKTFKQTDDQVDLWVPQSSRIVEEKRWVDRTFPPDSRFVTMMLTGEDVLTPAFLTAALDLYTKTGDLKVQGKRFSEICYSVQTPTGPRCFVSSLLELWSYNQTLLNSLTKTQIEDDVNTITQSPVYGTKLDVTTMLGGTLKKGVGGRIEAASAIQVTWLLSREEKVLETSKEYELAMIDLAKAGHAGIANVYVFTTRSVDDETLGAVDKDLLLLSAGFSIVFLFVLLCTSEYTLVHHRVIVASMGLGSVGLSIVFSYGLALACDVLYGPIHSILPFLLLGVGVDDMFVILQAWKNLSPEEELLPLPQRVALMMKHAGVSVTVTSITDVVAFGIGSTTVIPALSTFCVYAALGILALYALQSTFFVACLTLDQRRRESNRNACICCYKHKNYKPNPCSQKTFLPVFMEKYYGRLLMKLPVKILVILVTASMVGVFSWRFSLLKQEFDLFSYIPTDSYAYAYGEAKERYFPDAGIDTAVYFGDIDYYGKSNELDALHQTIKDSADTQNGTLFSWFQWYKDWRTGNGVVVTSEEDFYDKMFDFLTGDGVSLSRYVKMNSTTKPISIQASYMTHRHTLQATSASNIRVMQDLRVMCDSAAEKLPTLSGSGYSVFTYTDYYLYNETNLVILVELYRNLGLAAVCVLIVTLLLIADIWTSVLVFTCVVFTLINVAGAIEMLGTSVDAVSCCVLILCVGIAVDFSAHVGHTFMTLKGGRNERARSTLRTIGPAVLYGGLSTFLAFVLLVNSTSYGFVVFFRVFVTVVMFGLFHGLVYLPVVLSWVGPQPYDSNVNIIAVDKEITVQNPRSNSSLSNGHVARDIGNGYLRNQEIFTIETMEGDRRHNPPRTKSPYVPRPDYSPPPLSRQQRNGSLLKHSNKLNGRVLPSVQALRRVH